MNPNWRVRVYENGSSIPTDSWVIENRTEHEATREAEADMRQWPDADTWTMVQVGSPEDGF